MKDGYVVEKTPHQSEGPDYLQWQAEFEERASFLFGVPKMLWSNSNPSRKHKTLASGGEDSADKILASTVRYWASQLSAIGSSSYYSMFRDHHLVLRNAEERGVIPRRKSRLGQSSSRKRPKPKELESRASSIHEEKHESVLASIIAKTKEHPPELEEDSDFSAKKLPHLAKRKRADSFVDAVVKTESSTEEKDEDEEEEEEDEDETPPPPPSPPPLKKIKIEAAAATTRIGEARRTRAERAAQSQMRSALKKVSGQPQDDPTSSGVNEEPGPDGEDADGSSGDEEDGELFRFRRSASAEFSFPGIIDMRHVEEIYQKGLMKTKAFRVYVNRQYGIPLEDVESEVLDPPPLSAHMNKGLDAKAPLAGQSKKSPAAKPSASKKKKAAENRHAKEKQQQNSEVNRKKENRSRSRSQRKKQKRKQKKKQKKKQKSDADEDDSEDSDSSGPSDSDSDN
jgi:hypothetical protein